MGEDTHRWAKIFKKFFITENRFMQNNIEANLAQKMQKPQEDILK